MIKATVWTSWGTSTDHKKAKPKCIFNGEIQFPPNKEDLIVVREGFAAARVTGVIYDFIANDVEIRVAISDSDNEYGDCLYVTSTKAS